MHLEHRLDAVIDEAREQREQWPYVPTAVGDRHDFGVREITGDLVAKRVVDVRCNRHQDLRVVVHSIEQRVEIGPGLREVEMDDHGRASLRACSLADPRARHGRLGRAALVLADTDVVHERARRCRHRVGVSIPFRVEMW